MENPSASTTTVVIEVAFNTDPDLTAGQYTPATIKVGGTDAASIPAFDVVDNVSFPHILWLLIGI